MSVNGLNAAVTGMRANQFRLDTTANNVANVNTNGFQSRNVQTADRAYINSIGQGTRVASTYQDTRPGAPVPGYEIGVGAAGAGANGGVQAEPVTQSNTDMVREMTGMNTARAAYSANVVMGRTADEMTQTILDIKA